MTAVIIATALANKVNYRLKYEQLAYRMHSQSFGETPT